MLADNKKTFLMEEEVVEMLSRGTPATPKERDSSLRMALIAVLTEVEPSATTNSKKHECLKRFFREQKFMSYPTFNKFMNGTLEARKGLKEDQRRLLLEFINKKRRGTAPNAADVECSNST